jgi:EpsI family protein
MDSILRNKFALVLTVVLVAEGAFYYTALGSEKKPDTRPLEFFTQDFYGWHTLRQGQIDKEEQSVLRADDTLIREYENASLGAYATLFVAFFKTQRTGQAPHSPKNCLPGSGWEPLEEGTVDVPLAKLPAITVNRYVVARGENASVVFYWYQSRKRVIASDYAAKIWLVADSIRYHRSDTALVRIVVPVVQGNTGKATETGVAFIQSMFPLLLEYLPA